jgi:hypothetical protein
VEVSALGAVSHARVAAGYGDRFASLFTKGAGYWRAIACRRSGSVCLDTILRRHLATTMMPNVRSGSFASVGRCPSTFPIRTYSGARNLLIEGAAEACHAITMMSNISPPNIQCILFQFNGSHAQVTRAMLLGSRRPREQRESKVAPSDGFAARSATGKRLQIAGKMFLVRATAREKAIIRPSPSANALASGWNSPIWVLASTPGKH